MFFATVALATLGLVAGLPALRSRQSSHKNIAYQAYYQINGEYTPLLPIVDDDSTITHLLLFPVHLDENGNNVTLGDQAPTDTSFFGPDFWNDVATIQQKGITVMASLGGYLSASYLHLEDDFDTTYANLKNFLTTYNFQGLDLDVEPSNENENTASDPNLPSQSSVLRLLKQVRSDFGEDFIITMAPVAQDLTAAPANFSGLDYRTLDEQAVDSNGQPIINWFNGQFYNGFGDCDTVDTYTEIIKNGFAADRVVMGVITNGQWGSGWCSTQVLQDTVKDLNTLYPTYAGMGESEMRTMLTLDGFDWSIAGGSDNITNVQWFQNIGNAESGGGAVRL